MQSKDLETALNKKAGAIAIHAIGLTKKATPKKIERDIKWTAKTKEGLRRWTFKTHPQTLRSDKERRRYFRAILKLRKRSIAYLAAGWLPAVRKLIGRKPKKGLAKGGKGKVLGYAKKAKMTTLIQVAEIVNLAGQSSKKRTKKQKHTQHQAAKKFGEPALAKAFNKEQKDMVKYFEMKAQKAAKAAGVA
jgi:hypothetical protein